MLVAGVGSSRIGGGSDGFETTQPVTVAGCAVWWCSGDATSEVTITEKGKWEEPADSTK